MKKKDFVISYLLGWIIATFVYLIRFSLINEIPAQIVIIINKFLIFIFIPPLCTVFIYFAFKAARNWITIKQFSKYALVGFSNLSIDFGVLNILIYYTGRDKGIYFTVFKTISFSLTILNSYLWNKFWSFENRDMTRVGRQFAIFIVVALGGLIINVTVASFIVNAFNVESVSSLVWANIGAIISGFAVILWNFAGYKFVVFRTKG